MISVKSKISNISKSSEIPKISKISEIAKISKIFEIPKIANISEISEIAKISKISKIFKIFEIPKIANISEISEIAKISKISKIFKIFEIPKISEISKISRPNVQDFGKHKGELLKILEIANLQTCKEFSALQPQITASCQIVVLSWFKLSTENSGRFRNCRNFSNRNLGFYRLQRCLRRTLETGVEFALDVIPEQLKLRCGLWGGGGGGYHVYIYICILYIYIHGNPPPPPPCTHACLLNLGFGKGWVLGMPLFPWLSPKPAAERRGLMGSGECL